MFTKTGWTESIRISGRIELPQVNLIGTSQGIVILACRQRCIVSWRLYFSMYRRKVRNLLEFKCYLKCFVKSTPVYTELLITDK